MGENSLRKCGITPNSLLKLLGMAGIREISWLVRLNNEWVKTAQYAWAGI